MASLHFAQPIWLSALLLIPFIWILFFAYFRKHTPIHQLEKFIDKHLIPLLLRGAETQKKQRVWTQLLIWSAVWSCLVLGLAGPRWDFREIDTYSRDQSMVILLDLSESMNATDVKPSRLTRAKQMIEDLLNQSKGVKIGLLAFAADPHMIVPLTEDKETIKHLLPSLDTDIVYVQGSKLSPALDMAAVMLDNEPGTNKAIVVVSDGGFDDASAIHTAKNLAEKGIVLHTIGVGTSEGIPLKDRKGNLIKKNGSPIVSKMEKERFAEISKIGQGRNFDAGTSNQVTLIFKDLERKSDVQQKTHKTQKVWEEYFYVFLLPVIPFFLVWFRRGFIFAGFILFLIPVSSEASLDRYFNNSEQQANKAFLQGDYSTAGNEFQDPYRKGVALYKQGDYEKAEELFRQSARPEVASSAAYNLGNALALQNKLEEAIEAYEDVLKQWPDHKEAKDNLEIIKKMLEQKQQQQQDQDQQEDSDQNKSEDQQQKEQNKDSKSDDQKKENSEKDKKDKSQDQKDKKEDKAKNQEQQQNDSKEEPKLSNQEKSESKSRSQEDLDADLWLNQMKNEPKSFLKNKFYVESKKNGTKEEVDPW